MPLVDMASQVAPDASTLPKLLDQVHVRIRVGHYRIRTEDQYVQQIKRFIIFTASTIRADRGAVGVKAFLSALMMNGHVAASTQNQALPVVLTPAKMRGVTSPLDRL